MTVSGAPSFRQTYNVHARQLGCEGKWDGMGAGGGGGWGGLFGGRIKVAPSILGPTDKCPGKGGGGVLLGLELTEP